MAASNTPAKPADKPAAASDTNTAPVSDQKAAEHTAGNQLAAVGPSTKKPYYLKPGAGHSYIKDGELTVMKADGKETIELTDAQAKAFGDKFTEEAPKIVASEDKDAEGTPGTTNGDGMGPQQNPSA